MNQIHSPERKTAATRKTQVEPMQDAMLRNPRDEPGVPSVHLNASRASMVAAALVGLAMQGMFVGGLNAALGNRSAGNIALELSAAAGLAGLMIGAQLPENEKKRS